MRPNIVMIVADDLGWNDVGYHGSEIRTPNLDTLAAGGVKLDHYYVWPVCSPTRTALLTGRNPSRFDILSAIGGRSEQSVPLGTTTLADVLKGQGYATALTGKWHLGLRPAVGPRQYGFDYTYGYLHGQVEPYTHMYKIGDRDLARERRVPQGRGARHRPDRRGGGALDRDAAHGAVLPVRGVQRAAHAAERGRAEWVKPYEAEGPGGSPIRRAGSSPRPSATWTPPSAGSSRRSTRAAGASRP